MARPIVLSNGELHVGINRYGMVHDFYFPYVGLENHSAGADTRHKVGVWIDGTISWLDQPEWQLHFTTADYALVGHTSAKNEQLEILIEFDDFVDAGSNAFLRNIHIVNLADTERDIRLFMHQAFVIGDTRSNTDTVQYLPDSDAILHYHGRRAFVISGLKADGTSFDQHSVGLFGIEGHEGTYRDADDGELANGTVEHGRVDSTVRFKHVVAAHESVLVQYWIAAGTSTREALIVHKHLQENGLQSRLHETVHWWNNWLTPTVAFADKLPSLQQKQFIQSAMIVKSHIDKRGAVIASTDTTMLNYSRDAYGYCWPRDGAYALWPLIRIGYTDEPLRFFEFCQRALHPNGYLMHKYQADGALGSSWHPYVHGSISAPPIQEDETALVLIVFAQYYFLHPDMQLLKTFYTSLIQPIAEFMASYLDELTGLPKPSYDLWEEHFLTSTYTVSLVHASLQSAAELAEIMHDADNAVRWRSVSDDIQRAAHKHLYNQERKAFYKGLLVDRGEVVKNSTIDVSSFYGAFMYGLFPIGSEEIASSYKTLQQVFGLTKESPGIPRYENDNYQRVNDASLGNYWYITTLWLAQYANESGDKDRMKSILEWTHSHLDETGMMSEQLNPNTGSSVSVSPLVWSHAEYMATSLDSLIGDEHAS